MPHPTPSDALVDFLKVTDFLPVITMLGSTAILLLVVSATAFPGSRRSRSTSSNHHLLAPDVTAQYPYANSVGGRPPTNLGGWPVPAYGDYGHVWEPPGPGDITLSDPDSRMEYQSTKRRKAYSASWATPSSRTTLARPGREASSVRRWSRLARRGRRRSWDTAFRARSQGVPSCIFELQWVSKLGLGCENSPRVCVRVGVALSSCVCLQFSMLRLERCVHQRVSGTLPTQRAGQPPSRCPGWGRATAMDIADRQMPSDHSFFLIYRSWSYISKTPSQFCCSQCVISRQPRLFPRASSGESPSFQSWNRSRAR